MAKHGEGEQWYGKTCGNCGAPLNYAQASKGVIPGICGKCTDEVRRRLVVERRSGRHRAWSDDEAPPPRRWPALLLGLLVGLILGAAAAILYTKHVHEVDAWVKHYLGR